MVRRHRPRKSLLHRNPNYSHTPVPLAHIDHGRIVDYQGNHGLQYSPFVECRSQIRIAVYHHSHHRARIGGAVQEYMRLRRKIQTVDILSRLRNHQAVYSSHRRSSVEVAGNRHLNYRRTVEYIAPPHRCLHRHIHHHYCRTQVRTTPGHIAHHRHNPCPQSSPGVVNKH